MGVLDDYDVEDDLTLKQWDNSVEQMDLVIMPNSWRYYDKNVPTQVIKN